MAIIRKRPAETILLGDGNDSANNLKDYAATTAARLDAAEARLLELTPDPPAVYSVVAADVSAVLVAAGLMAAEV